MNDNTLAKSMTLIEGKFQIHRTDFTIMIKTLFVATLLPLEDAAGYAAVLATVQGSKYTPDPAVIIEHYLATAAPLPSTDLAWCEVQELAEYFGHMAAEPTVPIMLNPKPYPHGGTVPGPPRADMWSHEAVRKTAEVIGWEVICNPEEANFQEGIRKTWNREYAEQCRQWRGEVMAAINRGEWAQNRLLYAPYAPGRAKLLKSGPTRLKLAPSANEGPLMDASATLQRFQIKKLGENS